MTLFLRIIIQLSVSFLSYSVFNEQFVRTFVRWWRWWDSNPWPPACRAGALPAELHPHICMGFCFSPLFSNSFKLLVGPSGLEPPTSCLSGTRSNLLSYDPMWLVCGSPHSVFFRAESRFLCSHSVLALSYLPVPLPAKYFRHCRA